MLKELLLFTLKESPWVGVSYGNDMNVFVLAFGGLVIVGGGGMVNVVDCDCNEGRFCVDDFFRFDSNADFLRFAASKGLVTNGAFNTLRFDFLRDAMVKMRRGSF